MAEAAIKKAAFEKKIENASKQTLKKETSKATTASKKSEK